MQTFTMEMTEVPVDGGLTEDPSALDSVKAFLNNTSNREKIDQLLQEDGCIIKYRSLVDCLLAQLLPQFEDSCLAFYAGNGKPLADLYPTETIKAIDAELSLVLEVLFSREWATWADFKSDFRPEMKWEPL